MEVASFAEESCWKGEERRSSVKEIVFRVFSLGKIAGVRLDFELRASYGLWYDPDGDMLIEALRESRPGLPWDHYVYWKKPDHSRIAIIDPDTDQEVGSIVVRKRIGGDPVGDVDWTNVVCPIAWRLKS